MSNNKREITNEQQLVNSMKAAIREYLSQPQLQPQAMPPSQVVALLMQELYFNFCQGAALPRPSALDMVIEGMLRAGQEQQAQSKPSLIVPH